MLWISFILAIVRICLDDSTAATTPRPWTFAAHKACSHYLESHAFHPIYKSLLCADTHIPPSISLLFKSTGLYHLLVVSGSHFIFLEHLLQRVFKKNELLKFLVFIIFAAICLFQPPVTRALLSLMLQSLAQRFKLFWKPEQITLLSGLSCLILFPSWCLSLSLMLSWTASLALNFSSKTFYKHICIFLAMALFFPEIHPSSLFNNLIAAPILGFLHFPFTAATAFIPPVAPLGSWFWETTFSLMHVLPSSPESGINTSFPVLLFPYWIFIFAGHGILFLKRKLCRS